MERCWNQVPSVRPDIADTLAFFDAASRGWESPTFEAIACLSLDRATSQNSPTTESTFPTSRTASRTVGSDPVSPNEAGSLPPTPNGTEAIAVI